jgi:hypothetical protein
MGYILAYHPYVHKIMNRMEIFNEICTISAFMHLVLFTEPDVNVRSEYGWSLTVITGINILVNILVALIFSLIDLARGCKKKVKQKNA